LNAYNVFVGDPAYFSQDLTRYQEATKASVQSVAARYLGPQRVTLSVVPQGRVALAAPDSMPVVVS
jgi:predicted Zn-dependent peptidase